MSEGDIGFCSLSMGWRLHIGERSRWEAWIGKQVITGTFWEFLRKDPLQLGLEEKKKVMNLKVSIKFLTSGTLLLPATMAKLRQWLLSPVTWIQTPFLCIVY